MRLGLDERNVAEPIAPLICCSSVAWSIPRRSAGLKLTEVGQRRSTRLSMRLWATCCSSRSTSGRRSTSRRPARSPRSSPERARLPPPPCLAAARVTVTCAYVRSDAAIRSRPFPPCGRGRERSLSRGAGDPPAAAQWAAAGPLWKVRSSPRASNSAPFDLILTICLLLLPSVWPSDRPAGTSSRSHPTPSASTAAAPTPGPQP